MSEHHDSEQDYGWQEYQNKRPAFEYWNHTFDYEDYEQVWDLVWLIFVV